MRYWFLSVVAAAAFVSGPMAIATPAPADAATYTGKVLETMNAGTYTYIQVDTGKEKIWAAAPEFSVKVGDKVSFEEGLAMKDYKSKSLNRTFDSVYFVGGVKNLTTGASTAEESPAAKAPHPDFSKDPHEGIKGNAQKSSAAVTDFSGIKKAEGGMTVAEVYGQKAKLADQNITLRGKVVKYNSQIMGKNWAHVQDGTGTSGSNDLLVTTAATAQVGDTVLVTGKLALNKDFGFGYKYDVLVEDAKVTVESKAK
jgi:hypothetical protein